MRGNPARVLGERGEMTEGYSKEMTGRVHGSLREIPRGF